MKLESIQILRGIAAMLVVFYHARAWELQLITEAGGAEMPWMGGLFTNGYAGVDLFFVISGFIMVYVTGKTPPGGKSAGAFLFARALRIYPIWWIFAGLMTVYMLLVHGGAGVDAAGAHAISRSEPLIPYLVKSFLLLPQSEHPILGVGWTLVHEMYFYVVFAGMLMVPRKLWPVLLGGWFAIVLAGSLLGLSDTIAGNIIELITYPMTAEFIMGAGVGLLVTSGRRWKPGVMTLLGTLGLLTSLCLQGLETTFTLGWGRVLWFGVPCAVLVYAFACLDVSKRLSWLVPAGIGAAVCIGLFQMYGLSDKSPPPELMGATILSVTVGGIAMLVTLWTGWLIGVSAPDKLRDAYPRFEAVKRALSTVGDWSYALYLCHILVFATLAQLFSGAAGALGDSPLAVPFNLAAKGHFANIFYVTLGVALSIIVAGAAYRFIEKPLIRAFSGLRQSMFGDANAALKPAPHRAAIW
jgi:peptidoglycan/LPS O-acetylase OafA/YrhL